MPTGGDEADMGARDDLGAPQADVAVDEAAGGEVSLLYREGAAPPETFEPGACTWEQPWI